MRKSPENESKKERFKRLASMRTNIVLNRLKILGNCANRQMYEYSQDDVNKIFDEISRKSRETKAKFHFPSKEKFKL